MDSNFTEFSSEANTDDGSCSTLVVMGCTDEVYTEYNSNANTEDGSCTTLVVMGCLDSDYIDYNSEANTDDGSCATIIVMGCTDSTAFNHDSNANIDDGSCVPIIYGCTDPTAFNYNPDANVDDGSFIPFIYGCMNPVYTEYNSDANTDNGTCSTEVVMGCMDSDYTEYNAAANTDDSSCTTLVVMGCMDSDYIEYNAEANTDDGSCATIIVMGCMDEQAFNYNLYANIDDNTCIEIVFGCIDALALNYNTEANTDDGSCIDIVEGCMDEIAHNFNEYANTDDESCDYNCHPDWEVTLTDINHTLVIDGDWFDLNGALLSHGSYIGVFFDNGNGELQCAGLGQFQDGLVTIPVMGDDVFTLEIDGLLSGQNLVYKIWDVETCEDYPAFVSYLSGPDVYITNEITIIDGVYVDVGVEYPNSQQIELPESWFTFSTYINADDMSLESIFASILDEVIVVKNNGGFVYLPEYNFNGVGDVLIDQGYQVKMLNSSILTVNGTYALPEENTIFLPSGWNMISYLRLEPASIDVVFEQISQSGNLQIIKNYTGNVYLPEYSFNGIGDMLPGQGYQLKVINADELQYLSNDDSYRMSAMEVTENNVSQYAKVAPTNNNMTVVIEDATWDVLPIEGSEIAAFDKEGNMVGSAIYSSPVTVVTVWGDDATTVLKDGMLVSESVSFKVWNTNQVLDFTVEKWIEGSSSYQVDGISVASSIETNNVITNLNASERLLVKVINVLGQEVNMDEEPFNGTVLFNVYDDGSVEKFVHY